LVTGVTVPLRVVGILGTMCLLALPIGGPSYGGIGHPLDLMAEGLGAWSLTLLACLLCSFLAKKKGMEIAVTIASVLGILVGVGMDEKSLQVRVLSAVSYGSLTWVFWKASSWIWHVGESIPSRQEQESRGQAGQPTPTEQQRQGRLDTEGIGR